MIGLLRPSCAVRLFVSVAWHFFGAASVPTLFHSFLLDHPFKFILADVLLVNHPPVPNVAPTSCTSMTDLLHVVVGGCVFVSTSTLSHTNRCCGGLLSLCFMNAANSLRPSRSYVGCPFAVS